MTIYGRIFWGVCGWYASRIEGDSGMEVIMPLETAGDDPRWPSQSGQLEATQKGLGSPFWMEEMKNFFEMLDAVRDSEFDRSISQPSGGVEIYAEGEVGYDRNGVAVVVSIPDENGVLRDTYRPGYVAE